MEQTTDATPQVVESPAPAVEPEAVDQGTTETQPAADAGEEPKKEADPIRLAKEARTKWERAQRKIQERFSELTSTLKRKDEQIAQLVEALSGKATPQGQAENDDVEPVQRQDEDWETYLKRHARWVARKEAQEIVKREREQAERQAREHMTQQQAQKLATEWQKRQTEFAKQYPDYQQVVLENDAEVLPDGVAPLFMVVPNGHVAAYAIGKNPALAEQLWGKTPIEQAAIIGSIAAAFLSAPQTSNAPPPAAPVKAGRGASTSELSDDLPYDEWIKRRNAQLAKRD